MTTRNPITVRLDILTGLISALEDQGIDPKFARMLAEKLGPEVQDQIEDARAEGYRDAMRITMGEEVTK